MAPPHELLKHITVGELVASKTRTVCVTKNQLLTEVTKLLLDNNILSVPVQDEQGSFIGIVDMFQIMTAVAFGTFFKSGVFQEDVFTPRSLQCMTAGDVLGLSEEGKSLWIYNPEEPLEQVLEVFSKGVHRVLVRQVNEEGNPTVRLLSQSDVIHYISKHMLDFPELTEKPINQIGLASFPFVKSVPDSVTALAAYRVMVQEGLLAVPIVDQNGILVASLSTSDLRGLSIRNARAVLSPVTQFLGLRPVFSVRPTTTLGEVINSFLTNKIHRVWIVDDAQRVIGVVTMSDVITKFSPYDHKRVNISN